MGADSFAVRWRGQVQPRFDEAYTFYVKADDGLRLWVDGQLVLNVWRSNTYFGDWQFVVKETGTVVGWDVWRSAPYNQDVDSKVS